MNNANLKQILKKIDAIVSSFNNRTIQEVSNETNELKDRCEEIKRLIDNASSVYDINFLLEQIDDEVQSFLGLQKDEMNSIWKQSLNEMANSLQDRSNLKTLSKYCVGIFPEPVSVPCLYNKVRTNGFDIPEAMETSQKIPKVRNKRAEQRNPANCIKPVKVLSQTNDVDSHKHKMKICLDKLLEVCNWDENKSIPFFNFIINCESYVQTVYNSFTVSFLIRERLAKMSIDKNHQLWIRPSSKSLENSHIEDINSQIEDENDSLFQYIISINPKEWKMLIDSLGLTKSILPVLWPTVELGNIEFFKETNNDVHFLA
ncbi:hypothetical protein O3M35_011813 [Rhynocoris fuscipes]|uniref:Non-structural maintenance of chromosomes element 4 n=1 Tax=Rhynocoris fuscipes TaxID=488301 RepID=A0AAW1CXJ9_9HEMI